MGETHHSDGSHGNGRVGFTHATPVLPGDPGMADVLTLIQTTFAYMDGVIDPPSSMHSLTVADLGKPGVEVWAIGAPLVACVVLTPKPPVLYVGRLAVAADQRGKGYARALVGLATARALALGLDGLELQVRVELTANQAAFEAMGFKEVGRTAHVGYERVTSVTYRRGV